MLGPLTSVHFRYVHHKVCRAAQGVKIAAPDLEHAVAGSQLYVVRRPEDREAAMKEVMKDLENVTKLNNNKGGLGVYARRCRFRILFVFFPPLQCE